MARYGFEHSMDSSGAHTFGTLDEMAQYVTANIDGSAGGYCSYWAEDEDAKRELTPDEYEELASLSTYYEAP